MPANGTAAVKIKRGVGAEVTRARLSFNNVLPPINQSAVLFNGIAGINGAHLPLLNPEDIVRWATDRNKFLGTSCSAI